MHYDAISYHDPAFQCGISFAGTDRLVFGTDHPFFPPKLTPPETNIDAVPWPSTTKNIDVISRAGKEVQERVLWKNAMHLLKAARP
jgi:aminocarboxymuconate-semialdehyde decarboxylase